MNQSNNKSEHDDQKKFEITQLKIEGSKTGKNPLILIFFRLNRRHEN